MTLEDQAELMRHMLGDCRIDPGRVFIDEGSEVTVKLNGLTLDEQRLVWKGFALMGQAWVCWDCWNDGYTRTECIDFGHDTPVLEDMAGGRAQ